MLRARETISLVVLILGAIFGSNVLVMAKQPARAILFIVDGLHWKAPRRLSLENFLRLESQGSSFEAAHLLAPHHPTSGDWARLHTSSFPNPILLAGTLFLKSNQIWIQHLFYPERLTAHVTNSTSYASIDGGNTFSIQRPASDRQTIEWALQLFREDEIAFTRIHLQRTGDAGYECLTTPEKVPWKRNIWGEGSPYVAAAREADELLGLFIDELKAMGKWEDTLLVVTSDHGQVEEGWHPALSPDSWKTPLVFVGPGVLSGKRLQSAEHIDIAPTICYLMGVEPPASGPGAGRVLDEILQETEQSTPSPSGSTQKLNELLSEYAQLRARLHLRHDPYLDAVALLQERRFYGLDRFLEWHRAGSIQELLRINQDVIDQMKSALSSASNE